jgi:hypothetical protein
MNLIDDWGLGYPGVKKVEHFQDTVALHEGFKADG